MSAQQPPAQSERRLKAYYVRRPARTVTTFLVFAENAKQAVELAASEGEPLDSETLGVGKGTARRAPGEDEDDG